MHLCGALPTTLMNRVVTPAEEKSPFYLSVSHNPPLLGFLHKDPEFHESEPNFKVTGVKSWVVTRPEEKTWLSTPLAEAFFPKTKISLTSELNFKVTGVKSWGRHTRREDMVVNPLAEFLAKGRRLVLQVNLTLKGDWGKKLGSSHPKRRHGCQPPLLSFFSKTKIKITF